MTQRCSFCDIAHAETDGRCPTDLEYERGYRNGMNQKSKELEKCAERLSDQLAECRALLRECIVGIGPERFPQWLDETRHALGISEQEHVAAVWEANKAARAAGGDGE